MLLFTKRVIKQCNNNNYCPVPIFCICEEILKKIIFNTEHVVKRQKLIHALLWGIPHTTVKIKLLTVLLQEKLLSKSTKIWWHSGWPNMYYLFLPKTRISSIKASSAIIWTMKGMSKENKYQELGSESLQENICFQDSLNLNCHFSLGVVIGVHYMQKNVSSAGASQELLTVQFLKTLLLS